MRPGLKGVLGLGTATSKRHVEGKKKYVYAGVRVGRGTAGSLPPSGEGGVYVHGLISFSSVAVYDSPLNLLTPLKAI